MLLTLSDVTVSTVCHLQTNNGPALYNLPFIPTTMLTDPLLADAARNLKIIENWRAVHELAENTEKASNDESSKVFYKPMIMGPTHHI